MMTPVNDTVTFKLAGIVLGCQLISIFVFALIAWVTMGAEMGYSVVLGGGIYWVPQCLFSYIALRGGTAVKAKQVLWNFYAGMLVRLLATMALFAWALQWPDYDPLGLCLTYGGLISTQWALTMVVNNHS